MTGSNHRRKQTTMHHQHSVKTITKFKSDDNIIPMKRHSTDRNGSITLQPKCEPKSSNGGKPTTEIFESSVVTEYMLWKSVSTAGPGLRNHGNTCFLNSTIQCLLHTPALAQVLLKQSNLALKGLNSKNTNNPQKAILQLYQSLVVDVWSPSSKARSLSPRNMVQNIRRVGKQFRPNRQEDAHEYLRQLLDCMHEEILMANNIKSSDGKVAETTLISRVFGGYIRNELKCLSCNYSSKTYNHFQDLSLEISGSINSVSGALKAFIKSEKLSCGNEWRCDGCKMKVQALKQLTINAAPNVLVLHLKRFSYGGSSGKMNKKIDFELQLDVPCNGESSSSSLFNLIGIVVHHGGSIHSGHYVAFVKAPNGQWYEMDDEDVTAVTVQHVLRQQAYILFYSKKVSLGIKPEKQMHAKSDLTAAKVKNSQTTIKSHPSGTISKIKIDRNDSGELKGVETNFELVQPKCNQQLIKAKSVNEQHSFNMKSPQHCASLTQIARPVGLLPSSQPKERLVFSEPAAFGQLQKAAVVTIRDDHNIDHSAISKTPSCEEKCPTIICNNDSDVIQSVSLVKSSCLSSSAVLSKDMLMCDSAHLMKPINASRKRKTNATLDIISIPVLVPVQGPEPVPIKIPVLVPVPIQVPESVPVPQIRRCTVSPPFRFIGGSHRLPMSRIRRNSLRSTGMRMLKLRRVSQSQGLYSCVAKMHRKS